MTVLIGRGEATAIKIIKEMMPDAVIETQVPLHKLIIQDSRYDLSERQQKESIDIVVKRRHKPILCVRIQDKHHATRAFGHIDGVQKNYLQYSHNEVIDIPENECPELFKENLNNKSRHELGYYLRTYL